MSRPTSLQSEDQRSWTAATGELRIHVIQGEHHISADPRAMLTTILGSCVAACLRDPVARIGGMNHFLLPGGSEQHVRGLAVHAMEVLVNGLLQQGARRDRLEAHLFGGARMIDRLTDVGALNADFAEAFLAAEGIRYLGGSLRGAGGRRIQFWPVSGRARQLRLEHGGADVFASELRTRPTVAPVDSGALELF